MDINKTYNEWLNSPKVSKEDKELLKNMTKEQIDDAFFKNVEFGTAGMRGILGPGTNRLNFFTIKKATVGFAKYVLEKYPNAKENGIVISHDNRYFSREFTLDCAKTLNEFGINTFIFDSLRPTPELSFAVRYLKCVGGIMITASHNPKEHNGYKVYDETGCQLVPDKIKRLVEIISELPDPLNVEYEPAKELGKNTLIDKKLDDDYVSLVEQIAINRDLEKKDFKIVYTPNHGTSYVNAMRVFKDFGYNVTPVLKQCPPDPAFSGTLSPNPEDQRSYIEPIKLAKEIGAKLIVMTDPDGDRVGVAYLGRDGEYHTFTGNQSAALLLDYVLSERQKRGLLSKNGVMYNTIVTSSIGEKIASYYGVKTEQFLTGFKYIGNRIDYYEKNGGPTFEFGYEESYGCLIAPFARDKDGIQAILLYCEMALFYDLQGIFLDEAWDKLCERFGFYQDIVYSLDFPGSSGFEKMHSIMNALHENPFFELEGKKVIKVDDVLLSKTKKIDGETCLNLPKDNVIKLYFDDGTTISVRPSGTEPKIKFYIGFVNKAKPKDNSLVDKLYNSLKAKLGI